MECELISLMQMSMWHKIDILAQMQCNQSVLEQNIYLERVM